ncbi:MAG: hypothetical protein B7Z74_11110 [Deltaproteobacteria bacterium 21-66-5]|nr:MAG: hypothetical protein B7Z74_11110 [Deltaproteobacteria bacterium 21-66-5]
MKMVRVMRRHFAGRHERQLASLEAKLLLGLARELARAQRPDEARRATIEAFERALGPTGDGVSFDEACDNALAAAGFIKNDRLYRIAAALRKLRPYRWCGELIGRVCPAAPRGIIPD